MKSVRGIFGLSVAGAAIVALIGVAAAGGGEAGAAPDEAMPGSIVEDYSYPGADKIKEDTGVELISGDGHIMMADCATDQSVGIGLLKVRMTEGVGPDKRTIICFKITASTGYLNLRVPAVYEIQGDGRTEPGHKVRAELTTESGEDSTVEVDPNGSTAVGVAGPSQRPTTLLRLEVHG